MTIINHVVVGCGRIAPSHADAIASLEGAARLWGCCDIDEAAAASFADKFGIDRRYPRLEDVLADPEVHAISLATPHDLHASMAKAALERGKHVLVEKPFVLDTDVGRELVVLAERERRLLAPVAQHRYDALIVEIAELLASKALSQPRLVRMHIECARKPEYYRDSPWRGSWAREGGSVLMNQAYHLVDLLLHLCGPIADVEARYHTFAPADVMETEDTLVASLVLAGGGLVSLSVVGSAGSEWNTHFEFLAEDGALSFDINYPNRLHRFDLRSKPAMKKWRDRLRDAAGQPLTLTPAAGYYGTSHRAVLRDFIAAVARVEGGESPDLTAARQAIETVTVIQQIYDRARRGKTA
jgi:UDP-N-acetyl-2-amino-2-deoxyglucuronate dehydrogenase